MARALLPLLLGPLTAAGAALPDASVAIVGDVRVQALSPTLLRVEPRGPLGFEDRTTFMVVDRHAFAGVPITSRTELPEGTMLHTQAYDVLVRNGSANGCGRWTAESPARATDATMSLPAHTFPEGATSADRAQCSKLCESDRTCIAWTFNTTAQIEKAANCWLLASFASLVYSEAMEFGCLSSRGSFSRPSFAVIAGRRDRGDVIYDSAGDLNLRPNLLHWPPPLRSRSYALVDHPRFFVPEWGPTPIPATAAVDPALRLTNGYDFRNVVPGDTYVFLLGADLESWHSSRREFITLTGPTPLLPDYAYGTWSTWWHPYTEAEAKSDIAQWEAGRFPLDVWGLDLNWRNTSGDAEHYYDQPDLVAFPDFAEGGWFDWLRSKKLRTYLSDHPFPVAGRSGGGLQTSPEEVAFRWAGLSEWLGRGATWWWFDVNWGYSIPPPTVNATSDYSVWEGLDSGAWGSHVYYMSTEVYDRTVRDAAGETFYGGRPLLLSKFTCGDPGGRWGPLNWRPGADARGHGQSPSQHRYPVWWTGDDVDMQASVESMVDSGIYDLKPFVHSDCGGDFHEGPRPSSGSLIRWTAHCAFGTIFRYHGTDHRIWMYDERTQDVVRSYLNMRYRFMPALIAGGQEATRTGFPLVSRGDLFWPELAPESSSSHQYLFLRDTLVAPILNDGEPAHLQNVTGRQVWIPPGEWQDVWSGASVVGPQVLTATQPFERQPMWHRRPGLLVLCPEPMTRVEDQDWSTLILEAFPSSDEGSLNRSVYERGTAARMDISMRTWGDGRLRFEIGQPGDGTARNWLLRLHLLPGERVAAATLLRGAEVLGLNVSHIDPVHESADLFPFGGAGSPPPHLAGCIAEVHVPVGAGAGSVELTTLAARAPKRQVYLT